MLGTCSDKYGCVPEFRGDVDPFLGVRLTGVFLVAGFLVLLDEGVALFFFFFIGEGGG